MRKNGLVHLSKIKITALLALVLVAQVPAQTTATFKPFEDWKAAIIAGDQSALSKLYSTNPVATAQAGKDQIEIQNECAFWSGLKSAGMTGFNPRVLELTQVNGNIVLVLRITASAGNQNVYLAMKQMWVHEADDWKLVASKRSSHFMAEPVRSLPQPVKPNVHLYPEPQEAGPELVAAYAQAAKQKKRVLAIFGGNWCYDCHVLDTTLHSKDFASLVEANYVVVHINIGDEGKDNNDLAARLGVVLDKGVPSLVVIEPTGKVVYAQANGEFESTVKIGPDDVRTFLEKWRLKA